MEKANKSIVIAAPSCCGKSNFVNLLLDEKLPEIEKNINLIDPSTWIYKDIWLHEKELINMTNLRSSKYILHYTLPYPALKFIFRKGYDKKVRLSILQASHNITILTLFAEPSTLLKRIELRRNRIFEKRARNKRLILRSLKALRTLNHLNRIYSNPNKLISVYEKWFEVSRNFNSHSHFLVNVDSAPDLLPLEIWPEIKNKWRTKI